MINSQQVLDAQVSALLDDKSHHIEFNGHLTNHNKHAVLALNGLGATWDRIKYYYDSYAKLTPYGYGLEAPKHSKHIITEENWKLYLGMRSSYASYCDFFDKQEKKLGMDDLLSAFLPTLLPGWAGAFTHATIHLGWALEVNHRWMIIEGLAYMAFSYVSCHPERTFFSEGGADSDQSVLDSILRIAGIWEQQSEALHDWVETLIVKKNAASEGIHPELERSGLQYRIAKMLKYGHPLIYTNPAWLINPDLSSIWQEMHYAITLLYLARPGDFIVLHFITALHAMEQIAKRLPAQHQQFIVQCFWTGLLCIIFSRGEVSKRSELEQLHAQYKGLTDRDHRNSWGEIIAQAIEEEEEHNPKMVYVLRRMWNLSGQQAIFRIAASKFTTTPILPKSFELPPTE